MDGPLGAAMHTGTNQQKNRTHCHAIPEKHDYFAILILHYGNMGAQVFKLGMHN